MQRRLGRELLALPNSLTLLRLPLAILFVAVAGRPWLALLALAAAGLSDMLDGYLARRRAQKTQLGALLDGLLDKVFAGLVVGALLWHRQLSWASACLLGARELVELPLAAWWLWRSVRARTGAVAPSSSQPSANRLGKLATVAQYAAIAGVLFGSSFSGVLLALTAGLGVAAALSYWRRELSAREGRHQWRGSTRATERPGGERSVRALKT